MRREDDQELWDLLGKTSAPELSPFFARNVLRKIRQESGWRQNVRRWLRPRLVVPAAAAVLAMIVATMSFHLPGKGDVTDPTPDAVAVIDDQDYEVVADLDDLLAMEDDNLWDETSSL